MNSSVKSEPASTSIITGAYDSDEESFVVLERESMRYGEEACSMSIKPIEDCLSLVSKQLDAAMSSVSIKNENASSTSSIDDIQSRVVQLLEENKQLKDTLEQNNIAIKKQMEIICTWQLDMQKVQQTHKEKFAETKLYIDTLKKENLNLKDKLKQSESKMFTSSSTSQQITKQTKQESGNDGVNTILRKEYESLRELQEAQTKICQLETALKMIQLTNPHEELVKDLKNNLAQSNALNKELEQQVAVQKDEYNKRELQFWKDIEQLKKRQAENAKNENIQELLQNLRLQLMEAQEKVTMLTCDKQKVESILKAKENDFVALQQKYDSAVQELETVPVLKMQMEVYKSDFEAEKELARTLRTEKEKVVEDLNLIQHRNDKLLSDVERLRNIAMPANVSMTSSNNSSFQDLAPNQNYACPRCNFCFYNLKALENHVYRCIELDALP